MAPIATLHDRSPAQSPVLTGTGPYGATLKKGKISEPLTPIKGQASLITITDSNVEVKGHVNKSVMGKSVENDGVIEFANTNKDMPDDIDKDTNSDINSDTNSDVSEDLLEHVPNAGPRVIGPRVTGPSSVVTMSVVGCAVKTRGIRFG